MKHDYSTVTPAPPGPATTAQTFGKGLEDGVIVPLLQNVAGGIAAGMALAVLIAMWRAVGRDWNGFDWLANIGIAFMPAGLLLGLLVIFLTTVVRAFRDEVSFLVGSWSQAKEREQVAALQAQVENLQAAIRQTEERDAIMHRYAHLYAAEVIVNRAFSGQAISRDACMSQSKMTRGEWEAATELLTNAGVLDGKKITAPNAAAALVAIMEYQRGSGRYRRTASGDFAKV